MEKSSQTKTIRLGSGHLYFSEFDGETVPDAEGLCEDENLFGRISGGATLTYTPTKTTIEDDAARVSKTITTTEEAILKTGLITWNGNTLEVLCSTARVSEEGNRRTVLIGGGENENGKNYVLVFHHIDKKDGDIWVQIIGSNQAALELAFVKDAATTINAEFKAKPYLDEEGTLIKYIEEITAKTV